MKKIDDYDRDSSYIESIIEGEALSEIEDLAIGNALMTHPITRFVRSVPFQSTLYPAISDSSVSMYEMLSGNRLKGREKQLKNERKANQNGGRPNLVWSLPGQEKKDGCGVRRSDSGKMPIKMCEENPEDFIKAVSNHCGSIRCGSCMNYAAMMGGVRIEDRILSPNDLNGRMTGLYDKPKHWAISPPQEWMKKVMQRSDTFADLVDDLVKLLPLYGFDTGVLIFHPWRLSEDGKLWEFSPHFHAVGFGMFNNMKLRSDLALLDKSLGGIWNDNGKESSWVFNQIHAGEDIRSVRHTIGYILTHVGVGLFDYDLDFYDSDFDLIMPCEAGRSQRIPKDIPTFIYEQDWKSTGCYAEHLDEIDWTRRHMDKVVSQIQLYRIFGSTNKLRVFAVHEENVERLCPVCGAKIGLYQGIKDPCPQPVMYNQRSKMRCRREDLPFLREYWRDNRDSFRTEGLDGLDFAMHIPQLTTPETKGLQDRRRSMDIGIRAKKYDSVLVFKPIVRYGCPGFQPMIVSRSEATAMRSRDEVL